MESLRGLRSTPGTAAPAAPAAPVRRSEAPPAAPASDSFRSAPTSPALAARFGGFVRPDAPAAKPAAPAARGAEPAPDADDAEVASWCHDVARSGASVKERTDRISPVLARAVARAAKPDAAWTKATAGQIALFVQETLEHTDALQRIGSLRGENWSQHDFEGATSKFQPSLAQFMAKPGKDDSVQWAINKHNGAPHHSVWTDPSATSGLLKESASDIVNAWRMHRRVYDKPSWSWERIFRFIEVSFQYNEISAAQRDALLEAIPHQMEEERRNGLPA